MTDLSRRALFTRPSQLLKRSPPTPAAAPVRPLAVILDACLTENGAYCRTCGESCPEGAIRFHLLPQGRARADVSSDLCTGCGECLPPCPVSAIRLEPAPLPPGAPPT